MCEISNRHFSITIQPNQEAPEVFHCTVFKRGSHPTQIYSTVTIPYSNGTLNVLLEKPDADLTNWEFCVLGFNRDNRTPICTKTIALSTLFQNPLVAL